MDIVEHGRWYKCSDRKPTDYPPYGNSDGVSVLYVSTRDSTMAFFAHYSSVTGKYTKWKDNEEIKPFAFMLCPKTPVRLAQEAFDLFD